MSKLEKKTLEILVGESGQNGFPRDDFFWRLKESGINNPLPIIKNLCQKGLMRFDQNGDRRKGGMFKPLREGYVALGMS